MEIIWDIENQNLSRISVLTLGTFDGIHLGHQAIIKEVNREAKRLKAVSTLLTFEPHPQLVLDNKNLSRIRLLTDINERIDILSQLHLSQLVVIPFTRHFAETSPESFVKDMLVDKLKIKSIVIGHDHAFGKNRAGNYKLLESLGESLSFNVKTIEAVTNDGEVISSTLIRSCLENGSIEKANGYLGRPYMIRGKVIPGQGRGRKLGYPTANISPSFPYKLIPKPGIYSSTILVDGVRYNSVTYIGSRSTFDLQDKVVEVHVFDFDKELYDANVELSFYHFIRDDARYSSSEALVSQIRIDIERSLELLHSS
jgi:riboflavin kinase/FMN adenylyltransferase